MYITIDTSALIAVIGNEGSKQKIIERTEGCSLYAPSSVHLKKWVFTSWMSNHERI